MLIELAANERAVHGDFFNSKNHECTMLYQATPDILKFSPKQKASSGGSGKQTHTNPYIYSPEPRDHAFCLELNFHILEIGLQCIRFWLAY